MISTENSTSCTVFTVSDTPSSVTEPLRGDEARQFARGSQLEPRHVGQIVARDDGGNAVGMAGDDMAAELVADFERPFEIEPGADMPVRAVVMASVSAAASTSNQVLPPAAPKPTTVRHTPLQAIDAPSAMLACVVAAGDAQPMQPPLRRWRQRRDLADIGDYAGEHQARS